MHTNKDPFTTMSAVPLVEPLLIGGDVTWMTSIPSRKGFSAPGLSMTYTGTFELQGTDFAVFVSVDNSRFFFYAVEH